MKTIKQLSEELGCSKPAIMQKIKAAGIQDKLQKQGNKFLVDERTEKEIKQLFGKAAQHASEGSTGNQITDKLIEMLQAELQIKNNQIEQLQEIISRQQADISNLTAAVQESHTLHAGTMYQLQANNEQQQNTHAETKSEQGNEKAGGLFSRIFKL